MKKIFSVVKMAVFTFVALAVPYMLVMADSASYSPAGVKNSLVTMYNYQKGMLVNIFSADNDKMTTLIGGKYWKISYTGTDKSEIVETEYRYDSNTGAIESVYSKGTNALTLYVEGKSVMDVTVIGDVDLDTVKAYKDNNGKYQLDSAAGATGNVTITARYEYDASGSMKAKHIYGNVGTQNTKVSATDTTGGDSMAVDVDGNGALDDGFTEVQTLVFKDGKQDCVKSLWTQNEDHAWDFLGTNDNTGGFVTTQYLYKGNDLVGVLSGDSITKDSATGKYSGVKSIALYKAGKDDIAYTMDSTTLVTFQNGTLSVADKSGANSGKLDGAARVGINGATQTAVKTSQTFYDGVKKLYTEEYNTDSQTAADRGAKVTSKTVFDTHGRSAYSINYNEGKPDTLGKLWKYNDTGNANYRQYTFDMSPVEIKQMTDAAGNVISGKSVISIGGFQIELNCDPSAAQATINKLSAALQANAATFATALAAFNAQNGQVNTSANNASINSIRGLFYQIGSLKFAETTGTTSDGEGKQIFVAEMNEFKDRVTYNSSSLQYVLDFTQIKKKSEVTQADNPAEYKYFQDDPYADAIATVNITYNDANGQQKGMIQAQGVIRSDGSFSTNLEYDTASKQYVTLTHGAMQSLSSEGDTSGGSDVLE